MLCKVNISTFNVNGMLKKVLRWGVNLLITKHMYTLPSLFVSYQAYLCRTKLICSHFKSFNTKQHHRLLNTWSRFLRREAKRCSTSVVLLDFMASNKFWYKFLQTFTFGALIEFHSCAHIEYYWRKMIETHTSIHTYLITYEVFDLLFDIDKSWSQYLCLDAFSD